MPADQAREGRRLQACTAARTNSPGCAETAGMPTTIPGPPARPGSSRLASTRGGDHQGAGAGGGLRQQIGDRGLSSSSSGKAKSRRAGSPATGELNARALTLAAHPGPKPMKNR